MKPQFFRKVLKNGMTLLFEKRDLPSVCIAFAVKQGGINENAHEKGISHFIEHMLYKGTPTRNALQISSEIEKKGGDLNGLTSEIFTMYYCKMPSKHLDVALDVLSDMVKNPLFDEKELEKERKVIFEEMKMCRDSPSRYVFDKLQSLLYKEPFGIDLIGTEKTMNSIDRNKILSKFREVYQPENMILSVVGNADLDKLVDFAEKNFSKKKGKITELKVEVKTATDIETRKGIDQANLVFAFHTPLVNDKKSYAAKILATLIGGGMSSRLFNEIREKRNLAYHVKAEVDSHKDYSYLVIHVGTSKENIEKVKEIILKEFEKVSKTLGEKELKQVKEQMIGNYNLSMEDSSSQMLNLLIHEIDGNVFEFYEFEKNISDVKIEDVKKIAQKAKDGYSFFALVPE